MLAIFDGEGRAPESLVEAIGQASCVETVLQLPHAGVVGVAHGRSSKRVRGVAANAKPAADIRFLWSGGTVRSEIAVIHFRHSTA